MKQALYCAPGPLPLRSLAGVRLASTPRETKRLQKHTGDDPVIFQNATGEEGTLLGGDDGVGCLPVVQHGAAAGVAPNDVVAELPTGPGIDHPFAALEITEADGRGSPPVEAQDRQGVAVGHRFQQRFIQSHVHGSRQGPQRISRQVDCVILAPKMSRGRAIAPPPFS